jgi:hypothetical protein
VDQQQEIQEEMESKKKYPLNQKSDEKNQSPGNFPGFDFNRAKPELTDYALPLSIKFQYMNGSPYFLRSHMLYCSFVVSTNLEINGSLARTWS